MYSLINNNITIISNMFIKYVKLIIFIICSLAVSSVVNVKVQEQAPQFEGKAIVDGQIKNISLADFAGKYLVLFFYPLDL